MVSCLLLKKDCTLRHRTHLVVYTMPVHKIESLHSHFYAVLEPRTVREFFMVFFYFAMNPYFQILFFFSTDPFCSV